MPRNVSAVYCYTVQDVVAYEEEEVVEKREWKRRGRRDRRYTQRERYFDALIERDGTRR